MLINSTLRIYFYLLVFYGSGIEVTTSDWWKLVRKTLLCKKSGRNEHKIR